MPPDSSQRQETSELLDDIRYLNQTARLEIDEIGHRIRRRLSATGAPAGIAEPLLAEVADQLGRLVVKVRLAEKAVQSLQKKRGRTDARQRADKKNGLANGLCFPASQLAGNNNLLAMETSSNGINYCWSADDPETLFSFSLDRGKTLEMQIRMFALIKPEYARQLKIFVDGQYLKHRFYADGAEFVASCALPASGQATDTEVKIVLPGTHCPADLGGGLDGRTLGIAISEIRFGKPRSAFSHVLKRLRLKH